MGNIDGSPAPQRAPESEDTLQILRVRDDDQITRTDAHVLQACRVREYRLAEFSARDRDRRSIRFEIDDCRALVVFALQRHGIEQRMEVRTIREVEHKVTRDTYA